MVPVLKQVLAKLNIVSIIKCKVIYGPIHLHGMYFKNMYRLLGATHCSMMIQFYRTNTGNGKLLQTSLECMTVELELPNYPFSYDYQKYSYCTTKSWINHLQQYYCMIKYLLRQDKEYFPQNFENDKSLMESFINNGYCGHTLVAINRYRVFLKIDLLSDITTGNGKFISEQSYSRREGKCIRSVCNWPDQSRLGRHDWVERRRIIHSTVFVGLPAILLPSSCQQNYRMKI